MISVTIRIGEEIKEIWKRLAKKENRSLANYLAILLLREEDYEKGNSVTLESLNNKLDLIREDTKNIKRTSKPASNEKKENKYRDELQQVLDLELPDTLSYEMWKDWVIYLREKRKNKLTVKLATEILERWKEADENGWDLDELVQLAIQRKWSDAVWEKHINEERKEEKPFWADAK